jgi:hypothetical protein
MERCKFKLLITLWATALLVACGTPGAPVPPSLQLPRPPTDLTATRKGNQVTLIWTAPQLATDGQTIRAKHAGPTVICRAVSPAPVASCQPVGQRPPVIPVPPGRGERRGPATPQVQYVDTLPAELGRAHPTGFAQYAVEAQNSRGRDAGLSNQVRIPLALTPPPPADVETEVTADGIQVRWCSAAMPAVPGMTYTARVYRQEVAAAGSVVQVAGEPVEVPTSRRCPQPGAVLDRSFDWEKQYRYWVAGVTTLTEKGQTTVVEGEDSAPVMVLAHDIFPPAVPGGLQAVASGTGQKAFVDLTWRPDTEPDLAGYNVYRQQSEAGSWIKLNAAPVPEPAFRDEQVTPGGTYTYAVSAVDVRGNESGRSEPAGETLPQ